MPGTGVEHRQVPVLRALWEGQSPQITPDLIHGAETINQKALAAALALKSGSAAEASAVYDAQDRNGHMCGGPKSNEFLPPNPHDQLWYVGQGLMLLWAPTDEDRARGIDWFAQHHWLISKLWTARGLKTPCARFKWPPGMELGAGPDWTVSSLMHSDLSGFPDANLGRRRNIFPMQIWRQVLDKYGKAIRDRFAALTSVAVAVPVQRWDTEDGGYFAAFAEEREIYDPLWAIRVGGTGALIGGWKTLGEAPLPTYPPSAIIGHLAGSSVPAQAPPPALPGPGTAEPPIVPLAADLGALAARVETLKLSRRDLVAQDDAVRELRSLPPPPAARLDRIAETVESFGIGPGQSQKAEQEAIVAALRAMA